MKHKNIVALIVDNVSDRITETRELLEECDFCAVETDNWRNTLEEIRGDKLGLVVLDTEMSGLDNAKVLEIRKSRDTVLVILQTAVNQQVDSPKVLVRKIKEILGMNFETMSDAA